MPSRRRSSPKTTERQLDRLIDDAVAANARSLRSRGASGYDGVLGTLPDWLPDTLKNDFESARNRLLEHYTAEQITAFIESWIAEHQRAIANPTDALSRFPYVLPPRRLNDVSLLARLKTAAQMDKVKGIEYLLGANHARLVEKADGYSAHQSQIAKARRGKLPGGLPGGEQYIRDIIANIACGTPLEEMYSGLYQMKRPSLAAKASFKTALDDRGAFADVPADKTVKSSGVTAKAVWDQLVGSLDKEGYQVDEKWNSDDIKKSRLIYHDGIQQPKSISFGRVENILWEERKEWRKKSR